MLTSTVLDMFRGALFVLAHWCGGSFGAAIVIASVTLRLAMLPLSLPATRRRLVRERKMRALAPQLEKLRAQYADKPEALFAQTQRLHEQHGVSLFDRRMLLDGVLQFPPAAALYSAIRGIGSQAGGFLWMADLVRPDRALALSASVIAAAMGWLTISSTDARPMSVALPLAMTAAITLAILTHVSAGVALYSITNSVISGVETAIARRTLSPAGA